MEGDGGRSDVQRMACDGGGVTNCVRAFLPVNPRAARGAPESAASPVRARRREVGRDQRGGGERLRQEAVGGGLASEETFFVFFFALIDP